MKRRSFLQVLSLYAFILTNKLYACETSVFFNKRKSNKAQKASTGTRLCFIGIGGGATNILEDISKMDARSIMIHMNTDSESLKLKKSGKKILLNNETALGCGSDINCGKKSVTKEVKNQLKILTKNIDKVYVIATLGGGVSSGATPEIVKYLKLTLNKTVVVFSIMPFSFEGNKRLEIANKSKDKIEMYTNEHFTLENDSLLNKRFSQGVKACFLGMSKRVYRMVKTIEKEEHLS